MNSYKNIEDLRRSAGTLPSERPEKRTNVLFNLKSSVEVEIVDHSKNPFKAMFLTSTATWGDNEFKNKWRSISDPDSRFEVVKAVLTHNTLPQAREVIGMTFRVKGVPRWLFDYHTQVPFTTFMSIGCRDNNKLDSDIVLLEDSEHEIFSELKNLYEEILSIGEGSWQAARAFMPQSYSHSYFLHQNLLSISSVRFDKSEEAKYLKSLYSIIIDSVSEYSPLLSIYLQYIQSGKFDRFKEMIMKMDSKSLNNKDLNFLIEN